MKAVSHRSRLIVLTILVVLCFVGLGCRLVELQWARHYEFAKKAEQRHAKTYFREAPRGQIRDRRGNLLATSVPVKTVIADPSLIRGHETEMARLLAPLLKTNEAALAQLLSRSTRTNELGEVEDVKYVQLKQKVALEDYSKIRAALDERLTNSLAVKKLPSKEKTRLKGLWRNSISSTDDQIRQYPNGTLAAHVLGFIGPQELVKAGETNTVITGVEGIERTFDEKLRGARGWVKTEADAARRELYVFRDADVDARPGLNVVLTIDARVQQMVEEEIQPMVTEHFAVSGVAIVLRPKTGEILAIANYPTFDPNAPGKAKPASARLNHAINDQQEPGSTFKTVTVAGAFEDGVVQLTDMIGLDNGEFHYGGFILHDHDAKRVPAMTVKDVIAKSSNIGTAKIAIKMGRERIYKHMLNFGFGEKTGIPLTGEAPGYFPKVAQWRDIHVSRIPIGQGVTATPLQMAMSVAAIANGGVLMRPMLIDRLVDDKQQTVVKYPPVVARRVVSAAAARTTVSALKTVVEKGTADKAALEHYTVAGKTGTAQKVDPVLKRYSHDKYYASFIGFFPADNPELLIYVACDEPLKKTGYYGGSVCAPVFKRIAERAANYLNIQPDVQADKNDGRMADGTTSQRDVAQATRN
jgi:cell division protein FtsI (penicillin-binding protein 3)